MKPTSTIRLTAAVTLAACCDLSSAFQPSPAFTLGRHPSSSSSWNTPAITTPTKRNHKSTTQRNVVVVEDPTMVTSGLDAFFQSQPYLAAFLTCSVKAGTADLLAQKQALSGGAAAHRSIETREKQETSFDLPRNLSFVFYGGLVQGMFQQFLFSVIYPIMFGHDHTFFTTLQQVAFDVGVMPFVYLPIVYTIKSLFSASSMANSNNFFLETVQDGLAKLGDDILNKGLLKTYWSIWIPAQSLTFSVVPPHLRVLFVALVSFCWVTILSSISSSASTSATASLVSAVDKDASRMSPSLSSSSEGLMEALQWGADALQHESNNRVAFPSQGPVRRPAYVAVAVNAASASQRSMDGSRDQGASFSSQYRQ